MNQAKHTPGPWWAGTDEDANVVYAEEDGNAVEVASTLREDGDGDTEAANARLIVEAVNAMDPLRREVAILRRRLRQIAEGQCYQAETHAAAGLREADEIWPPEMKGGLA